MMAPTAEGDLNFSWASSASCKMRSWKPFLISSDRASRRALTATIAFSHALRSENRSTVSTGSMSHLMPFDSTKFRTFCTFSSSHLAILIASSTPWR